MDYYQLKCHTCNEAFTPLLASSIDEILSRDYDEMILQGAGQNNVEMLRAFHKRHAGHILDTVKMSDSKEN